MSAFGIKSAIGVSVGLLGLLGVLLCPERAATEPAKAKGKIEVPSERAGIVMVIGTELKEGEKLPPGQVIKVRIDDVEKQFRRLRVGDRVEEGQLLARLNDQLARQEQEIAEAKIQASQAELRSAEKTAAEAKFRFEAIQKVQKAAKGAVSLEEVRDRELTAARYAEEAAAKKEEVKIAILQHKIAGTVVRMHEIRSPVAGVIRAIYKQRGEAIKALEPIMLIEFEEEN